MRFRNVPVKLIAMIVGAFFHLQPVESHSPALLGVNLGRTHLTASIFNGSGPIALGRQLGSQSYQDFMVASLDDNNLSNMDPEPIKSMLMGELDNIRNLARTMASDDLRIGVISYPRHFPYRKPRDWVWDAACMLDPEFGDSAMRMRSDYTATVYTYPPSGCLESALNPWGPEGNDMVLMFDYSFQQLHVYLLDVDKVIVGLDFDGKLLWPNNRTALREVLLEPLKIVNESEIATVILSSDDSGYDYTELEQNLGGEFPILKSKLQIRSTGFEYIHAVGAACLARQIVAYPDTPEPSDFPYHDEI